MPIPVRETYSTDRQDLTVLVTDDGSLTLVRTGSDDAFHSGCGAASETRHVYLHNSGVVAKLRQRQPTRVLEVGLGTSMAMLMTVDVAVKHDCKLDYVAIETDWISASTLEYLHPRRWTARPEIVDSYLAFRRTLPNIVAPGTYCWQFDADRRVTIEVTDVRQWTNTTSHPFDAIYYDPFCPDSAPALWTPSCFKRMRESVSDDGRLTTYSCSRPVRTALEQAGWVVDRVPGPEGGKREVVVASPASSHVSA